jgi:phosphatidate cytidylyltransferase
MSGTAARVLTAIVLIPLVVSLVLWGPTWMVALLVAGVTLLALREFFALGAAMKMPGYPIWTMLCAMVLIYAQWKLGENLSRGIAPDYWAESGGALQSLPKEFVFLLFVLGAGVLALFSKRGTADALPSIGVSAASLLFIVLPFSYLVRFPSMGAVGRQLMLFTLLIVWVGDSVAFFVGRAFGRRKLAPTISPNKTWEGAAGNVVGSVLVAVPFYWWLHVPFMHLVAIAVLASVAGQVGDLLESAYKRGAGVKDSGKLLPGHGGMLDRIDALILATPVVWWYFGIQSWIR